ncbi:long-chain fatty acid--CoA ligase [Microbacterium protaetiae]|uniref:Long-chain fatty acid--CoA ligase n=1 Tax=Microbacterium protaetiae TaxID=2509458 RepID=A0A4P6EC50_9MICO|nr:class I adenylate-forming enzyme family protein [Microbacterium protaetiae]QAY59594.1 long-chain fatty acid--CoA ligase [Microbacterium protaetiae]
MPITGTILDVAARHPDRPAIGGGDGRLSYADLVDDSRRLFTVIDTLHREQRTPPSPARETGGIPITAVSVTSAFQTARIVAGLAGYRAVSATIDPRWPLEHQVGVIMATGVGVVVSDASDLADALAERGWSGTIVSLGELARREHDAAPATTPTVRADDEAFLMLFSSGTTSNPKAFLKTRRQYRANVAVSAAHLEPLPGVATLAPGPVSYSLTLYAVIECLATGGSVHVADAFDPIEAGRRIGDQRITRVVAVPAVVQALADAARRDPERFTSLELVVTGGANLPQSIRRGLAQVLPRVRLISYYGAAEIGFIGDSRAGDGRLISLYDGITAQIRGDSGAVPEEEPGTVWIHADACSEGYVSATTDEVLRDADGWATVHDLGRLVGGGLQLIGRAGDVAVTGGYKVALPEVERAFDGMPKLGAVCAVALPDARLGSVVALVCESDAGDSPPDKATLRSWARERLAPQSVPRRWYRLERLPRTVGGKIRRGETAELVTTGRAVRL